MLSEFDSDELRGKLATLNGEALKLVLHRDAAPDTALQERLAEVAQRIAAASGGGISLESGEGAGLAALPCLTIAHRGLGEIHYQALPEGPEAAPFLEALLGPEQSGAEPAESARLRLSELSRPADLWVFVGAGCPHCPGAVRSANHIALATPLVGVSIIDVQVHAELAERFNVRAVPLTILDGELAVNGVVQPSRLVDEMLSREADGHGQRVLLSLAEQGRFADAARRMQSARGTRDFAAIWRNSDTPVRIGLMMAVEEALQADRAALDGLVADLLPTLRTEDATLRGDTADLLGKIGHPAATDALRALLEDANSDVAEIASEALEEIGHRRAN